MAWSWRWVAVSVLVSGSMAVVLQANALGPQAETEPNGTAATATAIRFTRGYAIGAGTITPGGDLDFWSFTAPAGARVWVSTDTGGTQGGGATSRDTVMDLLAADGTTVIENDDDDGTGNGGNGTIETGLASNIAGRTLTEGGIYFIRVRAFSGTGVINPYRLLVAVTRMAPTAEVEPNDIFEDANQAAIPVGIRSGNIAAAGDVDVYEMFADVGDTLLFSADADPERDGTGTDLVVELRDPDSMALLLSVDSSITGSLANPAAETGNFTVVTPGNYFVRVRHFSATGIGSYHLMVARVRAGERPNDFDGDGKTDVGVYRESTGEWFILRSTDSTLFQQQWGCATCLDISVPGDFDLDGLADIGVYRNTSGDWFISSSSSGTGSLNWGAPSFGDIPTPADYDGDGATDPTVYRNTTGEWIIFNSFGPSETTLAWGAPALGDIPVPADYDGDGLADVAVYRDTTGEWFVRNSAGGSTMLAWGSASPVVDDIPVPGDYDGDGQADVAVYRNSTGEWFVRNSATSTATILGWGAPTLDDIPVPADYDGDGMTDIAVYRNTTGEWFVRYSSGGSMTIGWGAPSFGDIPLSRPSALR